GLLLVQNTEGPRDLGKHANRPPKIFDIFAHPTRFFLSFFTPATHTAPRHSLSSVLISRLRAPIFTFFSSSFSLARGPTMAFQPQAGAVARPRAGRAPTTRRPTHSLRCIKRLANA